MLSMLIYKVNSSFYLKNNLNYFLRKDNKLEKEKSKSN